MEQTCAMDESHYPPSDGVLAKFIDDNIFRAGLEMHRVKNPVWIEKDAKLVGQFANVIPILKVPPSSLMTKKPHPLSQMPLYFGFLPFLENCRTYYQ